VLLAWYWTQPGKKLVRLGDPTRYGVDRLIADLATLYREQPSLWRWDGDPAAIRWLDRGARAEDVAAFLRLDGDAHVLVALHRSAQPLGEWRAGVPARGRYRVRISTDDAPYGGAGSELPRVLDAEPRPSHGFAQSLALRLPPQSALVLVPEAM
jgi:1,4-alpha-glucan branching enzyme